MSKKLKTLVMATAAGAAIAYFMDSERGAQRREMAKQRAEQLKEQAMPKLQELRRHVDDSLPGDGAFTGNGVSLAAP